jgi:hypothetical protein
MASMNEVERARACAELCEHDGRGCKCAARYEGDCGCDDAEWASHHESARAIRDMLAIVEKLPVTADGVPVVPGACECVYIVDDDGDWWATNNLVLGGDGVWQAWQWKSWDAHESRGSRPSWSPVGVPSHGCVPVSDCYSTRAAAEAAREAEK